MEPNFFLFLFHFQMKAIASYGLITMPLLSFLDRPKGSN
jgi:hypothetical protein